MPTNRMEPPKTGPEPAKSAEPKPAETAAKSGGGLGAWLPLLVSVILMPAIAYAMTAYVMVPQLKSSLNGDTAEATPAKSASSSSHGEKSEGKKAESKGHESKAAEGKKGAEGKKNGEATKKVLAPLDKIIGTIDKTQGSRYLLVKMTLVGGNESLKDKVEENRDQLMDVAGTILSSKTLSDLERPGNKNLLRTELITAINAVMGPDSVQDIYFTEFNIQ